MAQAGRALFMERIFGSKLQKRFKHLRDPCLIAIWEMFHVLGFVHGDPAPGFNMLLQDNFLDSELNKETPITTNQESQAPEVNEAPVLTELKFEELVKEEVTEEPEAAAGAELAPLVKGEVREEAEFGPNTEVTAVSKSVEGGTTTGTAATVVSTVVSTVEAGTTRAAPTGDDAPPVVGTVAVTNTLGLASETKSESPVQTKDSEEIPTDNSHINNSPTDSEESEHTQQQGSDSPISPADFEAAWENQQQKLVIFDFGSAQSVAQIVQDAHKAAQKPSVASAETECCIMKVGEADAELEAALAKDVAAVR
jgi:hypothetical protein